ncbi:MAG: VIT and vWA domain-containing protein [Thermoanaerobaculia bacterium]
MKRSCKAGFLFLGLALLIALPGAPAERAQDKDQDRTLSPYFFVENGDPAVDKLPLKETKADVHIAGVIADVVVTQVYRNEGSRPLNARYVFPASTRAAVHGMTLQVGNERIRAKIREKQAAKREFEAAKAAGKSAALLEEQRPNVFSMSVANVMPQDEIRVELHYSELLVPSEGTYEFVYPTVVGPRYSNAPESKAESSGWVKSPYLHEKEEPPYAFNIETRVAAGMPIDEILCPSHQTHVDWEDGTTARVRLDPRETNGGNRDYILRYRLQGQQVQTGLLLYPGPSGQPGQDENFFLLMVQPPRRVVPAQIPPREYIFVLDVSGSMCGFPLNTTKVLMRELVGGLRPVDRFNVLLFSGASRLLAPRSLPATEANLSQAIAEIESERGGGETELGKALDRAMELPETKGVSRTMIVITDGFIDAEAGVFEQIRTRLNRSNLFAFGMGTSVNRHLIEGMARAGQGEPFIVTEPDEAKEVAKRFQEYVKSPVLTHMEVETSGFQRFDVEPLSIPDLFADRPLVIFGKWKGQPGGTIRVTGLGGDGRFEKVFDVAETRPSADNQALRYLWARERVARLTGYGADDGEATRQAVTGLGLKYELLTPYTSFVAVHEKVRNQEGSAKDVDQPLPLPQGVEDSAVGVPEPELPLLIALGILLLGLTAAAGRMRPRRASR